MTTTIYDDDDRAVSQYGPAPASWFNRWNWILGGGQSLTTDQFIESQDGRFQFTLQTGGNVVLSGPNGTLWTSNTNGQTVTQLTMGTDGNLVLYNGGTVVWSSGTSGGPTSYLTIQND